MPSRPKHLPDFDDPPVVETVLSVQFEPLPLLRTAHLGLLWHDYRRTFPRSEERPPLDPVVEQFPESPVARLGLKFQAFESFPVPRIWFTNGQGSEMIQVQNDRFIKNWRKEGEGDQYPHYDETIRPNFDSLDQAVARDPLPEEPAHGVVYGQKKRGGVGGKLRDGAIWVVSPVQSEIS